MPPDELEMINGQTAFVSAHNIDAWHRLGIVVPGDLDAAGVMRHAQLGDRNVTKVPIYAKLLHNDGYREVEVGNKYVTAFTNPATGEQEIVGGTDYNGVVGPDYQPFQAEEMTEFLEEFSQRSGGIYETAGSLRNYADIFLTMKMPEDMLVGGVDRLNMFIALLNNNTGRNGIRGLITPTRIVCANTQRAALANAVSYFSIPHMGNAKARIAEIQQGLDITFTWMQEFQDEAEKMLEEQLAVEAFREVCKQIWPVDDEAKDRAVTNAAARQGELDQLFLEADTNAEIRGTRWAGYQAVTEYLDHRAPVRIKGDAEFKALKRAERSLGPDVVKRKERAFALLKV